MDDLGGVGIDYDGAVLRRWRGERWRLFDIVGVFGDFEGGGAVAMEVKVFSFSHGVGV